MTPAPDPVQAQVWGLGRVAALEQPGPVGRSGRPAAGAGTSGPRRGCAAVLAGCGEDQVAIRPAGVLGRRLVRAPPPGRGRGGCRGGTVLVTGGTGAVGGHVARWLAGRGAPRVVLASRSGPAAAGVARLAAGLAGAGHARWTWWPATWRERAAGRGAAGLDRAGGPAADGGDARRRGRRTAARCAR